VSGTSIDRATSSVADGTVHDATACVAFVNTTSVWLLGQKVKTGAVWSVVTTNRASDGCAVAKELYASSSFCGCGT
jgi:hypothetical protein